MIILDTNVISEAAKANAHPAVERWLNNQAPKSLYGTAISLAEVLSGVESLPEGRRKSALRSDMLAIFNHYLAGGILPFDTDSAFAYGQLIATARTRGRSILMADGQIAAIAKVHGFTVATRDTSPFEAAGVPVINPWEN
jgi:toxin FitB